MCAYSFISFRVHCSDDLCERMTISCLITESGIKYQQLKSGRSVYFASFLNNDSSGYSKRNCEVGVFTTINKTGFTPSKYHTSSVYSCLLQNKKVGEELGKLGRGEVGREVW